MALNPATLIELPEQLRGYKLLERLGRGGFGEVWKVEAPGGFLKAMKFVFGDLESTEEEGRPAEQELKALHRVKSIRHPYILSLERFDIIQGQLIIVMELAERNLWDRFRECRMLGMTGIPRPELMQYMSEIGEALDLMNKHYNIQHLDIKPQNLFLMFDHVKVADFGLAKAFEGVRATVTGGVTPVYASPETFEGYVSRYCDQYSLAIVYQELLTGVRPFNGANTKHLLLQHLRDAPDLKSLPAHDRDIIGRALSKTPHDRWPTCTEMVQLLKNAPSRAMAEHCDSAALPLPDLNQLLTHSPALPLTTPLPAGKTLLASHNYDFAGPQTLMPQAGKNLGLEALAINPSNYSPNGIPKALPSLVTPKQSQSRPAMGTNVANTLQRQQIFETGRMGTMGIAPVEKAGEGVLLPAIIIGIGQAGAVVLRQIRSMIHERYQNQIPSVKFLYIDSDNDALNAAVQGEDAFDPSEVLAAKLNRPGHYLQREGLPSLENWMPQGMLYQLPKNPGPAAGIRAFGRLAFLDNYRTIAPRIRQAIEPLLNPDVLEQASKKTGLGIRTNQVRVYLVTGLAGGTGSGMFLDLAYLIQHELRQVGYRNPDTVGLLLVPKADSKSLSRTAQSNVYAALAELNHFAAGNTFQAQFDTTEPPIIDGDAAFHRTTLIQLPDRPGAKSLARTVGLIARGLFLELFTPTGRTTDFVRSVTPVDPFSGPTVQTFGLFRLSWPRPEILSCITRRFCQQLLRRWAEKESTHLGEPIGVWLANQWSRNQLSVESLVDRIQNSVTEALREKPENVFDAALDTLRTRTPSAARLDASAAVSVLEQILKLVGKPPGNLEPEVTPKLQEYVGEVSKTITAEAESHLSSVAVSFLEQPQYRLAGVEEALNQIKARLKQSIETLENLRITLAKETSDSYARLFPLIGNLNTTSGLGSFVSRKGAATSELLDLLGSYPRKRYRLLVLDTALSLYRGLLGGIPEYHRDVTHCRTRLEAISQSIGGAATVDLSSEPAAFILPVGCRTLEDASDQFIAALPPEDILEFDQGFQEIIRKKFRGLTTICLKPERSANFPQMFIEASRQFLDARLEYADPAEALTRYRGDGPECVEVLSQAYDEARPQLNLVDTRQQVEGTILAVPKGASGVRIQQLATEANPGVEFIPSEISDEVILYRELPRVPISELALLSEKNREVYLAQTRTEQSPHARVDVKWMAPQKPAAPR